MPSPLSLNCLFCLSPSVTTIEAEMKIKIFYFFPPVLYNIIFIWNFFNHALICILHALTTFNLRERWILIGKKRCICYEKEWIKWYCHIENVHQVGFCRRTEKNWRNYWKALKNVKGQTGWNKIKPEKTWTRSDTTAELLSALETLNSFPSRMAHHLKHSSLAVTNHFFFITEC